MRYPKTRYKRLTIQDFTGGLNTERSEFDIADNEFTVYQNVVLELGGPRVRGGFQITHSFTKKIISVFQHEKKLYLIFEDREFGVYDASVELYDPNFDGDAVPVVMNPYKKIDNLTDDITVIPKMVWFDPFIVLTVGDSVWVYDTASDTLTKTASPPAKDLLVKYGRVVIASGDEVWFSRVGDPTDWTPDSTDASAAQYFQIGYKEGKDITAINHFLDDILVFKEDRIYQLIGMSEVKLLNSKRGAINNSATVSLMSDVYAVDRNGLYSVVRDRFIDVVAGDLDLKIKTYFKQNLDKSVKIFYTPTFSAFLVKCKTKSFLYFYEYGSFAEFYTLLPVEFFVDEGVLLAFSNSVFKYNKNNSYDSYSGFIFGDNEEINADRTYIYELKKIQGKIRSKLFSIGKVNIIRFGLTLKDIAATGSMQIKVGKKDTTYSMNSSQKIDKHVHTNQTVDSFDFFISADVPLSIVRIFADYISMED